MELGQKKGKYAKVHKKEVKKNSMPARYMFIIPTCALIFFPVFFRGLFFERELRVVHIATFILVLIWTLLNYKNKDLAIVRFKYEYFLFAAVAMYIIVVPFAASQRMALLEALKYINYLAIYILVRDQVVQDRKTIIIYMNTILASVFAMSVIGLMNYIGLISTHGALTSGRISSTLQYPNTLAAVIGAGIFLSLYLAAESEKPIIKAAYIAVLNILLTTFILTFSRTMYVILPLLLIVFFVVAPSKLKGNLFTMILASAVPSLPAAVLLMRDNGMNSTTPIMILLISVLLSIILLYLTQRTKPVFSISRLSKYIAMGLLLVVIVLGTVALNTPQPLELSHHDTEDGYISRNKTVYSVEGRGDYLLRLDVTAKQSEEKPWMGRVVINSTDKTYKTSTIKNYYIREETDETVEIPFSTKDDTYYINVAIHNYYKGTSFIINGAEIIDRANGESLGDIKFSYKYLPDNIVSRIESMNLKTNSFQARIAFFRDAFSIIKDSFIIGMGGGAWQASYMKYRSFEYWTTQTHSYPIQVWMEIGTIGFLLVLGFAAYYTLNVIKAYKNTDTEKVKLQLAAIAAFALVILLHSLVDFDLSLGAVSILLWSSFALVGAQDIEHGKTVNRVNAYVKPVFAIALIVLLGVTTAMGTAEYYNQQTAEAFSNKEYQDAEKSAEMAVKLDPLNPAYRINLVNVINSVDIDRGDKYMRVKEQLEDAIKHNPFDTKLYGQMALLQFYNGRFDDALQSLDMAIMYNPTMSEAYMNKMDFLYNIAKYHFEQGDCIEAANALNELKNVREVMVDKNSKLLIPIEVKPGLLSYYYKANFILDDMGDEGIFNTANSIVMYEDFSFDTDSDSLPDLWSVPYQDDKIVEGHIEKKDGAGVFALTSDNPAFYIQMMDIGLEPSSKYVLVIDGYNKSPEGKLRVMIGSSSGKNEQFRDGYFAFSEESGIYQTTFETTDDITQGDQYIRLYLYGAEDKVVFKRIIIMKTN